MTIAEAIEQLVEIYQERGNVELINIGSDDQGPYFNTDLVFECVELEDDVSGEVVDVCAIMSADLLVPEETSKTPTLTVVK